MLTIIWNDVTSNVVAALLISAGMGVLGWIGWSGKKWLEAFITERTNPIQATANGGWSLPDAIKLMMTVDKKLDDVHTRITNVATDVAHLRGRFDQHIEEGE